MRRKASNDQGASWVDGLSRFQTTEWTQVQQSELNRAVIGELYLKYRKPVYLYLRGRGFGDDRARDLIQGFFTEKVLGQEIFQRADRSKGKFRTFLLTAIRNYAIDRHRTTKPMQQLDGNFERSSHDADPSKAFNRAWAAQMVEQTLGELEKECLIHGKHQHWNVFRLWLVEPDPADNKRDMAAVCRKLGIDDTNRAYHMIADMKKRFRKILRRCLHRYVSSERQVDEEIQSLLSIFSG